MNDLIKLADNIDYCEIIKTKKIKFPTTIVLAIGKYILNHPQDNMLFNLAKYIDNNYNALTLRSLDYVADSLGDKFLKTLYFWKRKKRHEIYDATGSYNIYNIKDFTDQELKHFLNIFGKDKKLIANEIMEREIYSQREINA